MISQGESGCVWLSVGENPGNNKGILICVLSMSMGTDNVLRALDIELRIVLKVDYYTAHWKHTLNTKIVYLLT